MAAKYHSRAMRRKFVQCFGLATGCKPAFLREAYHRLTGDRSASDTRSQAEVDARILQILDEEDPDLIWDMRTNNEGRPEEYGIFLELCQEYIVSTIKTAVDDRRHDAVDEEVVTHLATALSVRDLHEQVTLRCPGETKIPSIQWLRRQFWPRKPNAKSANYTGRLKIKFMVQARQFRANHVILLFLFCTGMQKNLVYALERIHHLSAWMTNILSRLVNQDVLLPL